MKRQNKAFEKLYATAEQQQGYFTAGQAVEAGVPDSAHPYHIKAGNWLREGRGIYRLKHFPVTDHPDFVRYALWSRSRSGQVEGIISHESALSYYDLSDLNPSKVHMTVPPDFRRSTASPKGLILHKGTVPEKDTSFVQGFRITRPARTILDLIYAGTVSEEFIVQAIDEALKQGKVTKRELERMEGWPYSVKEKIERYMKELKR